MKKIILYSFFACFLLLQAHAQTTNSSQLLASLQLAKSDDERQDIMMELFDLYENFSVDSNMVYSNKVLEIGRQSNNLLIEARALDEIGYVYLRLDNRQKCLEITLQSLKMAEKTGDKRLIGIIYIGLASVQEAGKSVQYLKTSINFLKNTNGYKELSIALNDITRSYLKLGMPDSALVYAQWAYKLMQQYNYYTYSGYTLSSLGTIHLEHGNKAKAFEYYHMAVTETLRQSSDALLHLAYNSFLLYYQNENIADSVIHYSQKMYDLAQRGPVRWMITPANIFYSYYKSQGKSDSALKYHEVYKWAQDSLYSSQKTQRVQAMSMEEDLRQKEIRLAQEAAKKERIQNIQYAAIAIGIIVFLFFFVLLSRSFFVNKRVITFFGVVGLLLVFEFINLVFHPMLGKLTNHSPFLMILAMVSIAAILVPAHHHLENWLIGKLVKKNKKTLLATSK